jgi:hypothetical protein
MARGLFHSTGRVWLASQAEQLSHVKRPWVCSQAGREVRGVHAFERRAQLSRSEQQRTYAVAQPDRSEVGHVQDGVRGLSKGLDERRSRPSPPSVAQLRFALTFARCVRRHGFPQFPDPLTTYGPGFTLGQGMYFPDNSTYHVQAPVFVHAAKACGVQLPSGGP